MSGEVVVDALPYIDQGYDEAGVREAALAMVEEECRRYRPTKNYLEQLPLSAPHSTATFETAMMQREMERLNARLPPEPLSMKRYELPPPAAGRLSDATAWAEAVDNSHAQLEHQATRVMNLELQLEYSCETWRAYLEALQKIVNVVQTRLTCLRKETAAVNWERKSVQTAIGSKLRGLEQTWVQLVSHNYSLERAIAEYEQELAELQNKNQDEIDKHYEVDLSLGNHTEEISESNNEIESKKTSVRKAEYSEEDEIPAEKKRKNTTQEDMFAD